MTILKNKLKMSGS